MAGIRQDCKEGGQNTGNLCEYTMFVDADAVSLSINIQASENCSKTFYIQKSDADTS